jgi:putative nucleotidyltransferase with HDIG domain
MGPGSLSLMETAAINAEDIEIRDDNLPVLSTVATKAMALIDSEESSAKELEDLIRHDPSLTTALLRVANSALYGARTEIMSVGDAVVRLGIREIKNTILVAEIGGVFPKNDVVARELWRHALATAFMSKWLAKETQTGAPEESFIDGMLHDIGKVVIYAQRPEPYRLIMNEALQKRCRFYEHERNRVHMCSHATVGARLAKKWGLSQKTVAVIMCHHLVEEGPIPGVDPDLERDIALVALANLTANRLGFGTEDPELMEAASERPASLIQFDKASLEGRSEVIEKKLTIQMASFL